MHYKIFDVFYNFGFGYDHFGILYVCFDQPSRLKRFYFDIVLVILPKLILLLFIEVDEFLKSFFVYQNY